MITTIDRLFHLIILLGAASLAFYGCSCGSQDKREFEECALYETHSGGVCVSLVGDRCETPADCESRICFERMCTVECRDNDDCPPEYVCRNAGEREQKYCLLPVGDAPECENDRDCFSDYVCIAGSCVYAGNGEEPQCKVASDCGERERCFEGSCLAEDRGAVGEPCDPYWRAECPEGTHCAPLSYTNGICAAPCDADNPCEPNYVCRATPGGRYYCLPGEWQCFNDEFCGYEEKICAFILGGASQRVIGVCGDPVEGRVKLGEACEPGAIECEGGVCPEDGICSKPCGSDGDCPPAFLCEEVYFQTVSGQPTKTFGCVDMSRAKARFGERCMAGGEECRGGVCRVEGEGGAPPFCTYYCDNISASCPYGYECVEEGGKNLCAPVLKRDSECSKDEECGVGNICGVEVDRERNEVRVFCMPGISGGAPQGSFCDYITGAPYCENGLCEYPGICGGLCGGPGDCPPGLTCGYAEVNRGDGVSERIRRCMSEYGSQKLCESDGDCPAGEICAIYLPRRSSYPQQRCMVKSSLGKPVGESCQFSFECNSLLCARNGKCTTLCKTSGDCPEEHFCGVVLAPISETLEAPLRGCVFNQGNTGELGSPCPNGAFDCPQPLLCYEDKNTSFCTKHCAVDTDCGDGVEFRCGILEDPAKTYCYPAGYEPP